MPPSKSSPFFQGPKPALAVAFLLFVVAYFDTLTSLSRQWLAFDGNQSHGIAVILLCIYLSGKLLLASEPLKPTPSLKGIAGLSLCSVGWYVAALANIDIIQQLILLPILFFIFYALLGRPYAIALLPCLGMLVFVIPVWDYLVPGLVDIASNAVGSMISFSHIPAYIVGNSFFLPDGQIDIVGGCSGVKYLTIALVIAYYILLTSESSLMQKAGIIVLSIALSVLVNWVRIYTIILIAHRSKMQSSLVADHDNFGWLLFVLVLIPIIALSRRMKAKGIEQRAIAINPDGNAPQRVHLLFTVVACIAVLIGPLLLNLASFSAPPAIEANFFEGISDLKIRGESPTNVLTINKAKRNTSYQVLYHDHRMNIEVIENWQLSKSEKLIPYTTSLYNRELWTVKMNAEYTLDDGDRVQLLQLEQKPYGDSQFMAYWFDIGPYRSPSYAVAKLLQIPASIFGFNSFKAHAVRMECLQTNCDTARQQVLALVSELYSIEKH